MRARQRGSVLATALFVTVPILLWVQVVLGRSATELRSAERVIDSSQAFHLAEAAADQAIQVFLRANGDFSAWADGSRDPACPSGVTCRSVTQTLPAGTASTLVIDPGGSTPTIRATGTADEAATTIEVVFATPHERGPFEYAILAASNIALAPGARTDAFDSRLGAYGERLPTPDRRFGQWNLSQPERSSTWMGHLRTNSKAPDVIRFDQDVRLLHHAKVFGDVILGPGADPRRAVRLGPRSSVFGTIYTASAPATLEPVAPFTLQSGAKPYTHRPCGRSAPPIELDIDEMDAAFVRIHHNCDVILQGTGALHLKNLVLAPGVSLQMVGQGHLDLYVGEDVRIYHNSRIDLDPALSVTLHVGRHVAFAPGVQVNASGSSKPSRFNVEVAKARQVRVYHNAEFHGTIRAPQSYVSIAPGAKVFGAVIGREVRVYHQGQVHYDVALGEECEGCGSSDQPAIVSWRVVE